MVGEIKKVGWVFIFGVGFLGVIVEDVKNKLMWIGIFVDVMGNNYFMYM